MNLSPNLCLANPGREYVIYAPSGGEMGLGLTKAAGSLSMGWLDPLGLPSRWPRAGGRDL